MYIFKFFFEPSEDSTPISKDHAILFLYLPTKARPQVGTSQMEEFLPLIFYIYYIISLRIFQIYLKNKSEK